MAIRLKAFLLLSTFLSPSSSFIFPTTPICSRNVLSLKGSAYADKKTSIHREAAVSDESITQRATSSELLFEEFTKFLISHQSNMIEEIEQVDGSGEKFSEDPWGVFDKHSDTEATKKGIKSGGITRVIQSGDVVEKGACSLTVIRDGILTRDRAATIRGRQGNDAIDIKEGDTYSAAALSVVLHTRNPMVPTFRSDVRIFLVTPSGGGRSAAWFGGGSDLTPYYLFDEDITEFHTKLKDMCDTHFRGENSLTYGNMKKSCDDYFYLPARSEHRGTGGIFFDDVDASSETMAFVMDVASGWMPSWLPIVKRRGELPYTEEQRHWQCLRRGRYLEFNLLYDRGVKFGLANATPRVEGVMVSAPPMIAFDYNHVLKPGSKEERLVAVLKEPKSWVV